MALHSAHILLIDEDEMFLEIIESAIYLHNPAYRIHKANSLKSAVMHLGANHVDIVVTEVEFSTGGEMAQFLLGLQKRTPPPVVVALTGASMLNQRHRLRVNAWLTKPPEPDALLARIDELAASVRDSVLRGVSLESFLQMIAHDRKTCTLTITAGPRVGRMYLQNGRLVHADTPAVQSKAAAMAILSWPECTIRISDGCNAVPSISDPLTTILLEACVYRDLIASADFSGILPLRHS